jgi:hypothetical protein
MRLKGAHGRFYESFKGEHLRKRHRDARLDAWDAIGETLAPRRPPIDRPEGANDRDHQRRRHDPPACWYREEDRLLGGRPEQERRA